MKATDIKTVTMYLIDSYTRVITAKDFLKEGRSLILKNPVETVFGRGFESLVRNNFSDGNNIKVTRYSDTIKGMAVEMSVTPSK